MLLNTIQLLRIKDWLKNFVIFFPIIFSNNIYSLVNLKNVFLTFVIFSIAASCIYILNDIVDYQDDKLHKLKKFKKPLASNKLSIHFARNLFLVFISFLLLFLFLFPVIIYFILIYFLINVSYSLFFKKIKYLEMILICSGYLIRLYLGSYVIDVQTSFLLAISIFSLSLFVISIKRLLEVLKQETSRIKSLNYSKKSLNFIIIINGCIFLFCSFVFIIFSNNLLILIFPFLIFVVYKYYKISFQKEMGEFPIDLILLEKQILFPSLIIIFITILIYM